MNSAFSSCFYIHTRNVEKIVRWIVSNSKALLVILAGFAVLSPSAMAGGVSNGAASLSFSIRDDAGNMIQSENVSGFVSVDPETGSVSTPAPGAALAGNWTWSTVDLVTGASLSQAVMHWHTDLKGTDDRWLSVVQLKATGNVDPFMSYSFSAKNNTALNQNYSFSYGETVVPPVAGDFSLYSDFGGSLTHGSISPIAQLTPTLGDLDGDSILEIQTLKLSTDGGLTFTNAGVDLGGVQTRVPTGTSVFGPFDDVITGNLGTINYWQFDVGFTLTPGRDAVGLTGFAELVATSNIPEPSTYALLISSLVFGAVVVRRRHRNREAFAVL